MGVPWRVCCRRLAGQSEFMQPFIGKCRYKRNNSVEIGPSGCVDRAPRSNLPAGFARRATHLSVRKIGVTREIMMRRYLFAIAAAALAAGGTMIGGRAEATP